MREFTHAGHSFTLCAGFYPDGRLGEVFLNAHKTTGQIEAIARDAAIILSLALQFGADLETICGALTKDHDGGPAATPLGALLDLVEEKR